MFGFVGQLRLAEDKREEVEARARMLEKQVLINLLIFQILIIGWLKSEK